MITDERIAAYIDSLEKEPDELLGILEKEALQDFIPIIKKPAQGLLRFLLRSHHPENILEVGAAVGFSSIFMSQYVDENARITTIEKMEDRAELARRNIKRAGKESKIQLIEGDAAAVLEELEKKQVCYDMIFMDAAKGQYLNFLPAVLGLLKKNGILVSDNVLQDGDLIESRYAVIRRNRTIHFRMREYLYTLTHSENLDTIVLPIGDGITLSTKIR